MADTLPEGTDHILPGAASTTPDTFDDATPKRNGAAKAAIGDLKGQAADKASAFKAQAGDKARDYAEQGKVRASGALDEVAKMIGGTADTIEEKLGGVYADYARRAADAVSGAADSLREKDVDELMDDARGLVRKSPAIAIGAAAAAGFVIARIIKAGSEALDTAAKDVTPKAASKAAPAKAATTAAKAPRKAPAKPRARAKPATDA